MNNCDDSIRVIDCESAAYLKSRGDMLFSYSNSINYLKGAFIESQKVESIINCINARQKDYQPYILPCVDEDN